MTAIRMLALDADTLTPALGQNQSGSRINPSETQRCPIVVPDAADARENPTSSRISNR